MNPMQKYPHITELFACIRKMLAFMLLLPTNSLISSGTCSTPKCVPTSAYSSRFIMYAPSFVFNGRLFLEKTPLSFGSFPYKDETVLEIPFFSSVSSYNSFSC